MNNYITENSAKKEFEKIYAVLRLEDKFYALNAAVIKEILKTAKLDCPAKQSFGIKGFIKYRENMMSVVDLKTILGFENTSYSANSKILAVEEKTQNGQERFFAIIADDVEDVRKIEDEDIQNMPSRSNDGILKGVYSKNFENCYVIDLANVAKAVFKKDAATNLPKKKGGEIVPQNSAKPKNSPVPFGAGYLFNSGVIFEVGENKYYIDMKNVKEFYKIKNTNIIKVPSVKDFIIGLVNVKGEYVTVLDIKKFRGNTKTEIREKSTVIILASDEFKIGILADVILENANIEFESLSEKEDGAGFRTFVKDGEIYQIIDVEKLLEDKRLHIVS